MQRIFDAHSHVVDPAHPLVPNDGSCRAPLPRAITCVGVEPLGVVGGAVVSGSFQAYDHGHLLDALCALGSSFVGVTQLPSDVSEETVLGLDRVGVRAVRFDLYRGGSAGPVDPAALTARIHALAGWHSELYVDAADLVELEPVLARLQQSAERVYVGCRGRCCHRGGA